MWEGVGYAGMEIIIARSPYKKLSPLDAVLRPIAANGRTRSEKTPVGIQIGRVLPETSSTPASVTGYSIDGRQHKAVKPPPIFHDSEGQLGFIVASVRNGDSHAAASIVIDAKGI
jgi:hypothetical protein